VPGDVIEIGQSLLRYDGPELALTADAQAEPTVLVAAEVPAVQPPPPPIETGEVEAVELLKPTVRLPPKPVSSFDAWVLVAGAALVLIGLVVTLSAFR
jgi:hypothetical protein